NAGHLPPLVISPVGQAALLEGGAPPLGSSPLTVYGEHVAAIAPGATIILFTDGLVEVRGESLDAGLARLVAAASTHARDDLEMLLDRLLSQVGSDSPADDVALLAVRAAPLNPASLALRLPAAPGSLPVLRHTLGRWLAQAGAGESDIYEISVACAEAYTNSIEHGFSAAPNDAVGLIVDLSGVTYLDSRGLHLLFELAERLRVRDQLLHVVVPETALIGNMLKLTQFSSVVPVFATVQEAVDEML